MNIVLDALIQSCQKVTGMSVVVYPNMRLINVYSSCYVKN